MKYEVIIFDADETLFDFKKSEREAFKNSMLEFGVDYSEDFHLPIYKDINTAIWIELEKGLIDQKKLKTERFKRLFNKLCLEFDEYEFAKSYMSHLSNASFLYDFSIDILKKLEVNFRLTIITNGLTNVQTNRIGKSEIANFFEDILISENVNVSKPDPRIFEIALKNINYTNKSKVLIVGDSLTSDIQGGINFGIDTCWFNPNAIINNKDIIPTYEITDLYDLIELLN